MHCIFRVVIILSFPLWFFFPLKLWEKMYLTLFIVTIITLLCVCVLVTQSCPTLCNPMDCRPPGSSVHGILQARILEWVAMPSSRGSSPPRDWTQVSCIGRQILYHLSHQGRPLCYWSMLINWHGISSLDRLEVIFIERMCFFMKNMCAISLFLIILCLHTNM